MLLSPAPPRLRRRLPELWRCGCPAGVPTGRVGSGVCVGNCKSTELAPGRIPALQRVFIELACSNRFGVLLLFFSFFLPTLCWF